MVARSNRHDEHNEGEFGYRPRPRDRRLSSSLVGRSTDNSFKDGELSLPVARRVQCGKALPTGKLNQIRVSLPLQDDIREIFGGGFDPKWAKTFAEKQGPNCSSVLIADMLHRLEQQLGNAPMSQPEKFLSIVSIMLELCRCFVKVERNIEPRELSTCMRIMGRMLGWYRHLEERPLDQEKLQAHELNTMQGQLVNLWARSLEYKRQEMNSIDCMAAIHGITASKEWFYQQMQAPDRKLALPISMVLKTTCDILSDQLTSDEEAPLLYLVTLLRHCSLESFASIHLLSRCSEKVWERDADGQTIFDRFPGSLNRNLNLQISTLFATSLFGVCNQEELNRIEGDLKRLIRTNQMDLISAEMIAEFLATSIAHNHRPDDTLVRTLEILLPESLKASQHDARSTGRVAYYATASLLILRNVPLQRTWQIATEWPRLALDASSQAERRVASALKQMSARWGLAVEREVMYGPCQLDFHVTIKDSLHSPKVNVEVDGRPYHSVFDIDAQQVSEKRGPFKNTLRDMVLKKRGDFRIVRILTEEIYQREPEEVDALIEDRVLPHLGINRQSESVPNSADPGPS